MSKSGKAWRLDVTLHRFSNILKENTSFHGLYSLHLTSTVPLTFIITFNLLDKNYSEVYPGMMARILLNTKSL